VTDAMTEHRTTDDPIEPTPSPRATPRPPSITTTASVVSGGHLKWLGYTWAITAVVFAVVMALIIRVGGHLDSSLWESAGASWQRYVIFAAGVSTLPSFLAMFVGNGVTRSQLSASSTVSMVVVATAGTMFVIAGFVAEGLIVGSVGWTQAMDDGYPAASAGEYVVLALRYAVIFSTWFSAGWLIGTGFYRYGTLGGIALIIPFAVPVLLCELLVGQAAASINVDVLHDHVQTPAAIGLLVGVGLVAMNATIARAFTRGASVHSA
jgi:hypothetical protein